MNEIKRSFLTGKENGVKVAVYRFSNLMGHFRPKYNSVVSTFCWAVANDEPFTVNDRSTELELFYIDGLVEFEVSGDKIEAIYMIPGWTHNIINLSQTENLVTVMTCNEVFDPGKTDTFGEVV